MAEVPKGTLRMARVRRIPVSQALHLPVHPPAVLSLRHPATVPVASRSVSLSAFLRISVPHVRVGVLLAHAALLHVMLAAIAAAVSSISAMRPNAEASVLASIPASSSSDPVLRTPRSARQILTVRRLRPHRIRHQEATHRCRAVRAPKFPLKLSGAVSDASCVARILHFPATHRRAFLWESVHARSIRRPNLAT